MKTLKKITITLLACLMLVACSHEEENVPEEPKYNIAGKTFYNTYNEFDDSNFCKVWFGKDGSFTLDDCFFDGTYEISGSYTISENVITLTVEHTGIGDFKKILFEIDDDDHITLKTSLAGSTTDDSFVTDISAPDGGGPDASADFIEKTFYNITNDSFIELHSDGKFALTEVRGMGATLVEGSYCRVGDVYMFDYSDPLYDFNNNQVLNFEFAIIDENNIKLLKDLEASAKDDIFCTTDVEYERSTTYIYETDMASNPDYYPFIQLDDQGYFTFIENVYAGMAQISGTYENTGNGIVCTVTDNHEMMGFAGQDVTKIEFEFYGDNLILHTDICMSVEGSIFKLK